MSIWLACFVRPSATIRLADQLRAEGATVDEVPVEVRRRRPRRNAHETLIRPAVPGLLFVELGSQQAAEAALARLGGRARWVLREGRPARVAGWELERLKEASRREAAIPRTLASPRFSVGERVKVTGGPLTGWTARVIRDVSGTVHLEVEGPQMKVELGAFFLERLPSE